jgi:hypothetical protein
MATELPPNPELEVNSEEWRVRKHREKFLLEAGFSEFSAFRLAMRFDIEKERAAGLLERSGDELWVMDQLID